MLAAHIPMKRSLVLFALLLLISCGPPKHDPIVDEATVVAKNSSLRLKNSSTSRTLPVLDTGDKVNVLEQQENWYHVRYGSEVEGWMEASTVVTNHTREQIQKLVAESQNLEPQNTAVLKQDGNLRLEPGRSTLIIRKL